MDRVTSKVLIEGAIFFWASYENNIPKRFRHNHKRGVCEGPSSPQKRKRPNLVCVGHIYLVQVECGGKKKLIHSCHTKRKTLYYGPSANE